MFTTYFRNLIMNNVFKTDTSTPLPSTYYLAWSTVVPDNDGVGANFTEPNLATGYVRTQITGLSIASDGMIKNNNYLSFPESIASQGIAKAYGVYDISTGGNLLFYNTLESEKTVDSETTFTLKPEQLVLSLTDA
jgi:hypothetical protein